MTDPLLLLASLLPDFARYLLHERGLSPLTLACYQSTLRGLIRDLCRSLGRPPTLSDLTQEILQRWLASLSERGQHASTIGTKKAGLVTFFRFLRKRGLAAPVVYFQEIDVPKRPAPAYRFFAKPEVRRLVLAPLLHKDPIARRDGVMLHVAYEGGLRSSEVVNLDCDSILMDSPRPGQVTLQIHGKGSKEREVTLQASTPLLRGYMGWRQAAPGEKALFVSQRGGRRLNRRAVNYLVTRWGQRAGLTGRIYPHRIRHSAGRHLRENGVQLENIKDFLGHEDVRTTRIYAPAPPEEVQGLVERHPLNLREGEVPPTQEEMLREVLERVRGLPSRKAAAPNRRPPRTRPPRKRAPAQAGPHRGGTSPSRRGRT